MSWISDVKTEIKTLEINKKKLRSFGLLIGSIFILISAWTYFSKNNHADVNGSAFTYIFLAAGAILFILGALSPMLLKSFYKLWMGLAASLGWVVSRIMILLLFFIIVTPLALAAKVFKKNFLDLKFRDTKNSYWILKSPDTPVNYRKMY